MVLLDFTEKTKKPIKVYLYYLNTGLQSKFSSFYTNVLFSVTRSNPEYHITFIHLVSFGL